MALSDPVGELEGCLSFYAGSHTCGQLSHDTPQQKLASDINLLSMGQLYPVNICKLYQTLIPFALHCEQARLPSILLIAFTRQARIDHRCLEWAWHCGI